MKKKVLMHAFAFLLALCVVPAHAQFNIGNKIKNKLNQKMDQKIDKTIDDTLDGKKKNGAAATASEETPSGGGGGSAAVAEAGSMKAWTKYDFVPGEKIIFADNLAGEEVGEFPSRWDLNHGNAEIAMFGDEKVINLVQTGTDVEPLVKGERWLPETFTIEMDLYFETDNGNVAYNIFLLNDADQYEEALDGDFWNALDIRANMARFKTFGSESEELAAKGVKNQWRHVAISFNKRSMKVYLDEQRLINIPNVSGKPSGLRIEVDKRIEATTMVKNVMIAQGGKKLYDQVMADGKIVTYGIKFDVNQATIRPESVGTLAGIAQLLQEQPSLKFSVEGHTDSDGDDNSNIKLSQQRAEAVKAYLVEQGIAAERLAAKGLGESKPIDKNNTPEAKSNNRRVEFVKL
ncbi:OmpA family protein [Pontibacter mangrovi]|uniref:OmpA family protein n=1 Tax=Pontibacter mangrovi TaxID=2589816 RepID=A0A501VX01_9BACT|nr:OmpA family protein [Pontibacter mangrovi]TPE40610.1 OmpA family protein [Pontibacter mangrovi]